MRSARVIALCVSVMAALMPVVLVEQSASAAATTAYTILESDGCALGTVNLTDGTVTQVAASPSGDACVSDLAFGPDGTLYGLLQSGDSGLTVHIVTFSLTTGAPTDLGALTGPFTSSTLFGEDLGIATGPANTLFVEMGTDQTGCTAALCLYTVDPATLASTLVGPAGVPSGPFDDKPLLQLTGDCAAPLWTTVSRAETESNYLTAIDPTSGTATQGAAYSFHRPAGLEIDKSTGVLYAIATSDEGYQLYTVDSATSQGTLVTAVNDNSHNFTGLAIPGACATPVVPVTPAPPAAAPLAVAARFTG